MKAFSLLLCAFATQGTIQGRLKAVFERIQRPTHVNAKNSMAESQSQAPPREYEYIVIGSGAGGLSCGAMLAKEQNEVLVVEAHDRPGGCCHSFRRKTKEGTWDFEVGPSVLQSLGDEDSVNPLRMVLDELGETFDSIEYDGCGMWTEEGYWRYQLGPESAEGGVKDMLRQMSSNPQQAIKEYDELKDNLRLISKIHDACPLTSLRQDWGALLTTGIGMVPLMLKKPIAVMKELPKILDSFHTISDPIIKDTHLKRFIDILSYFSGFPANGTIGAAMIYCLQEFHKPQASLAIPVGGSPAIVDALVRALEKKGGELQLNAKVDEILVENGEAKGVRLKTGEVIRASKGVISGATVWDTVKMLRDEAGPKVENYRKEVMDNVPAFGSILHLFLGIDGDLPTAPNGKKLDPSQLIVRDWDRPLSDPQNVITISIPTLKDKSIAPKGKHIVHVYTAGTEPFELWKEVDGDKEAYDRLKEERLKILWEAVDRVLPGVKDRVELQVDGTPLTHAAFLHRHQGTYGPALKAGGKLFGFLPLPEIPLLLYDTPVKGLFRCGDSTFPGPGVPAAVASGAIVANTLTPWWRHVQKVFDQQPQTSTPKEKEIPRIPQRVSPSLSPRVSIPSSPVAPRIPNIVSAPQTGAAYSTVRMRDSPGSVRARRSK